MVVVAVEGANEVPDSMIDSMVEDEGEDVELRGANVVAEEEEDKEEHGERISSMNMDMTTPRWVVPSIRPLAP